MGRATVFCEVGGKERGGGGDGVIVDDEGRRRRPQPAVALWVTALDPRPFILAAKGVLNGLSFDA